MKIYLVVVIAILIMAYLEITERYKQLYDFVLKQIKDVLPILKISLLAIIGSSILILLVRGLS